MRTNEPKALYIHVPFCDVICAYCDFTRVVTHPKLIEDYLYALHEEIKLYPEVQYETIYVGGGTPSALNMDQLQTLFEIIKPHSTSVKEYTIEVNPESLTVEKVQLFINYGINRISFGVQSFNQDELDFMHRGHTTSMIKQGIDWLRHAGIMNINIDLIYALPMQTLKKWSYNLEQALLMDIDHISLYALTIEDNAKFGRMKIKPVASETEEDMYELAIETLAKAGFHRYEISNFTRSKPSQHNLHYWHYDDYIGLGPGAVSLYQGRRIENTKNLLYYSQFKFHGAIIELTKEDLMFEFIMMGMRVQSGIELKRFEKRFNESLLDVYASAIDSETNKGLIEVVNGFVRCTDRGYGLLHDVLLVFMES